MGAALDLKTVVIITGFVQKLTDFKESVIGHKALTDGALVISKFM